MVRTIIAALAIGIVNSPAYCQVQGDKFVMVPLTDVATGPSPEVIGGKPSEPKDWPATFVFETNSGFCTSTAVSNRVILTAAHCISDGASGVIKLTSQEIAVKCRNHPDYQSDRPNISADISVCTTDKQLKIKHFERVNTRGSLVSPGRDVTLLGYGCRARGGAGPSGSLYEGQARVVLTPGPAPEQHYMVVKGGAAVCFGDSGGGAYIADGTVLYMVGINSRGDIQTTSWLSTTSQPSLLKFIQDTAKQVGAKVCGVDDSAEECRP
ncbi:S1 family peptidase [Prosthecomicrobium sp. N25]|uniref:S1 family peptidase n=1 Tax=Prosthecomicrobium sp. N25 TaxID=3129254 RepID=UPI00307767DB